MNQIFYVEMEYYYMYIENSLLRVTLVNFATSRYATEHAYFELIKFN